VGNVEQGVGQEEEHNLSQSMQDGEERQPTYQQAVDSQGNASSSLMAIGGQASEISCSIPEVEEVAVVGPCLNAHGRQPVYQRQANDDRGDGVNHLHPMVLGGQAREASCPIPEMEEIAGLNTRKQQPVCHHSDVERGNSHSLLNGGDHVSREESLSIQEPETCQLVNGQQGQPCYQQSAQANTLNYPTEEIGLEGSQRRDRQEVCHPIQETGPSAERTPDEDEDLPLCHQLLNGADINGVSSTGERDQAVEYTCRNQELKLWRQKRDRQADFNYDHYICIGKECMVIYVMSTVTGGNNHYFF